jgi:hypothetical protein
MAIIKEIEKVEETPKKVIMLESTSSPIIPFETIVVKVAKIRHQGKDYYFDSVSGKTYDKTSAGVGSYVGRYNAEAEQLHTDYPDSDLELDVS